MNLDLRSYFGVKAYVIARTISDTDIIIRLSVTDRSRGHHMIYRHLRFGFTPGFLGMRWPWSKIGWHDVDTYDKPDAELGSRHLKARVVGVSFHEESAPYEGSSVKH